VPAALNALINQLMEKTPEKRPGSAAEVAERLRELEPVVQPAAPAGPAVSRGRRGWLPYVAAALAFLFAVGGGLATYKLVFETKEGSLIVEVEDDAEVRFKDGELRVYGDDGKLKYTLKPSEKNKSLPEGQYRVKVEGVDGLDLDTDRFEIKKDGKRKVRVRAVAGAKKEEPKKEGDADRKAAEWVLSGGGAVVVRAEGKDAQDVDVRQAKDLPATPFRLGGGSAR
jgi:hypothetical protein